MTNVQAYVLYLITNVKAYVLYLITNVKAYVLYLITNVKASSGIQVQTIWSENNHRRWPQYPGCSPATNPWCFLLPGNQLLPNLDKDNNLSPNPGKEIKGRSPTFQGWKLSAATGQKRLEIITSHRLKGGNILEGSLPSLIYMDCSSINPFGWWANKLISSPAQTRELQRHENLALTRS